MALRNRIHELRRAKGWSQQQLANLINIPSVDSSRVSKLERADDVTIEWMERLAPIFGVHPTEIIDDTPRGVSSVPTAPEARIYVPSGKADVLQRLATPGHTLWEILADSLDQLELRAGAFVLVENITRADTLIMGDSVIVVYQPPGGAELPLLRQFIEPSLLTTNRAAGNAVPFNLRVDPVRIVGRILHRIYPTRR
jgi:transcriptional regulator with XRE-family HTH domain